MALDGDVRSISIGISMETSLLSFEGEAFSVTANASASMDLESTGDDEAFNGRCGESQRIGEVDVIVEIGEDNDDEEDRFS